VPLDAHADLYDVFEGDRLTHACPFARILEERLVGRLVQVGHPDAERAAAAYGILARNIPALVWLPGMITPQFDGHTEAYGKTSWLSHSTCTS